MSWSKIKLGEVIKQRKGFILIDDNSEYKLCRVQVHRKGVILRKIAKGNTIKTKRQQLCKAGDFLVAEMDAKVGGYGFVPEELDGAIVSSHYFLFELDETKIRRKFLEVISQLQILQEQIKAVGSTNYAAIRPTNVLNWEIPITDIQGQIKIENLFDEVREKSESLISEQFQQLDIIKKYRQQILKDSMQGKLVLQNKNDESASKLLEKIRAKKASSNKDKKQKSLPEIKAEEIPFDIPKNWIWCRLGEIAEIIRGKGPKYSENGIQRMLNQKCIRWFNIDLRFAKPVEKIWYLEVPTKYKITRSDVLVNSTGDGTIGRCAIAGIDSEGFIFDSHILNIRSAINQKFICYIINSKYGQELIEKIKGAKSTKQTELGVSNLEKFFIPLPPFPEQERIVSRIEKLMILCEELEANVKANQEYTNLLYQTALKEALQPSSTIEKGLAVTTKPLKRYKEQSAACQIDLEKINQIPFEKPITSPINKIQDINWELAMMVACIENKLGVTYGDVGLQKNVFNVSVLGKVFSKQYDFINYNYGTYSQELKADLRSNPYLAKKNINGKEVYTIKEKFKKEVLNKIAAPENKAFVQAFSQLLTLYELPFINKETNRIELFNTVLKIALDKKTKDLDVIYQEMNNWSIKQTKYKTKGEKFSKLDTKKMLQLLSKHNMLV